MAEVHGMDVARYEESFLRETISRRMFVGGIKSLGAYGERLAVSPAEAGLLLGSLHVNHSYFFRDALAFALLEQRILPELVAAKKNSGHGEIRVWSAGCAAGQEAWSVAMLLNDICQTQGGRVGYRIFATDLDGANVSFARAGVYDTQSVGNVRMRHLERYLRRQGDSFAIMPVLRAHVDFSAYDLLESMSSCPPASVYGGFDLILCCNVMFYYRPEGRKRIMEKFNQSLAPHGYLVTGEVERLTVCEHQGFRLLRPPVAVFGKRAFADET